MCMFSDKREKCGWVRAKEDAKFWIFGYCARLERHRLLFGILVRDGRKESQWSGRRNIEVTRNRGERLFQSVRDRPRSIPLALRYHYESSRDCFSLFRPCGQHCPVVRLQKLSQISPRHPAPFPCPSSVTRQIVGQRGRVESGNIFLVELRHRSWRARGTHGYSSALLIPSLPWPMVVLRVGICRLPLRDGKMHPFNALEHFFIYIKALLLNRIQNIVVPNRRPPLHHTRSAHDLQSRWVLSMILPSIFPMDLSSTYSRMVLRLPSMYYVFKSLVLWTILALQALDYLSSTSWKPLQLLDNWVARKEMDEICWSTFLAICGALCVGALTRGLEGVGATNAAPFNLVRSFPFCAQSTLF